MLRSILIVCWISRKPSAMKLRPPMTWRNWTPFCLAMNNRDSNISTTIGCTFR